MVYISSGYLLWIETQEAFFLMQFISIGLPSNSDSRAPHPLPLLPSQLIPHPSHKRGRRKKLRRRKSPAKDGMVEIEEDLPEELIEFKKRKSCLIFLSSPLSSSFLIPSFQGLEVSQEKAHFDSISALIHMSILSQKKKQTQIVVSLSRFYSHC